MKRIKLVIFLLIVSIIQAQAAPQYILIKVQFWGGMKMIHVEKPKKKLHKWCYDKKTDTYYRMKNAFGFGIRLKSAN